MSAVSVGSLLPAGAAYAASGVTSSVNRHPKGTPYWSAPLILSTLRGALHKGVLFPRRITLAGAKAGVDVAPRKRPTLGFLASTGPFHGILQTPARLLIERELLRGVLLHNFLENFDHAVQVFERLE